MYKYSYSVFIPQLQEYVDFNGRTWKYSKIILDDILCGYGVFFVSYARMHFIYDDPNMISNQIAVFLKMSGSVFLKNIAFSPRPYFENENIFVGRC